MTTILESQSPQRANSTDVKSLGRLLDAQAPEAIRLIDVRTPAEHAEVHIAGSRLVPLDQLSNEAIEEHFACDGPLYVLCHSGNRAKQAIKKIEAAGIENAVLIEGGISAWEEAGLPVVRGDRKTISLERQVRIAAGSLVVAGVVLGWLVHPAWLGIAGFVGAGLVFAGATDTCGMGMMLARMPWNRK